MRCHACNTPLPEGTSEDKPTGRWYCRDCFSWTEIEILRLAGKDGYDFFVLEDSLEEVEIYDYDLDKKDNNKDECIDEYI